MNSAHSPHAWRSAAVLACWLATQAPLMADEGAIVGLLPAGAKFQSAQAIDRASGKKYSGQLEAEGAFRIGGLPLGAAYDCVFDFAEGRLEGINLTVPASDYVEEQPLSEDDIATITEKIKGMNKFEDKVEVLALEGNIQYAAVLLNKLRTRPFYESKPGEVIWRVELWHFERPEETWVKLQDELFITLYRERLQKKDFERKRIAFAPSLGGLQPTADAPLVDVGQLPTLPSTPGIRILGPSEKESQP